MCVCVCVYIYTHAHISDCEDNVYELPLLPNNTVSETFLHKSGAVGSVDWTSITGTSAVAVTGRIRDIAQNVLSSSLQTESSSSSSYFHIFSPFRIPRRSLC